jgi:hypothetical protein
MRKEQLYIGNNLKLLVMILTICLLILVYTILGKDIKQLERLKNVDWKGYCDKMTPAIENKVQDVLDEWFGPEYTLSDAKS